MTGIKWLANKLGCLVQKSSKAVNLEALKQVGLV